MRDNNPGNDQAKKHFIIKLIPPRPTFHLDMSEDERYTMKQHAVYWNSLVDKGVVIVFGPVLDPRGIYGLGIMEVKTEHQARAFIADDPAVKSGLVEMEIYTILATTRK